MLRKGLTAALVLLIASGARLAAQESAIPLSRDYQTAVREGRAAAEGTVTGTWIVLPLVATAAFGPFAAAVVPLALVTPARPPAELLPSPVTGEYERGFLAGFARQVRRDRLGRALLGAAAGTVMYYVTRRALDEGGGEGGGGVPPPPPQQ